MKKLLSILSISVVTFFTSCSKDDDTQPIVTKDAIIKIEVLHTSNDIDKYQETNTIQVVGNNSVNVTGANWDDVQNPASGTKWFLLQQDVKPSSTYVTSEKVKVLTYASVINPKQQNTAPLNTTIKIYKDNKLVITKNFTTTNQMTTISIPSEDI